jgi:hypothetical protein
MFKRKEILTYGVEFITLCYEDDVNSQKLEDLY